jgi:hypothetical protein
MAIKNFLYFIKLIFIQIHLIPAMAKKDVATQSGYFFQQFPTIKALTAIGKATQTLVLLTN